MGNTLIVIRGPIGVGKSSTAKAVRDLSPRDISYIETDAIKRMIDPSQSSDWRRNTAHEASLFIVDRLLQVPRSAIIEMHTKYPEEIDKLAKIAVKNGADFHSVLLTAPLDVCKERTASRTVDGIGYPIDDTMVENYYCNLEPRSDDLVFDTITLKPYQIAEAITRAAFSSNSTSQIL